MDAETAAAAVRQAACTALTKAIREFKVPYPEAAEANQDATAEEEQDKEDKEDVPTTEVITIVHLVQGHIMLSRT